MPENVPCDSSIIFRFSLIAYGQSLPVIRGELAKIYTSSSHAIMFENTRHHFSTMHIDKIIRSRRKTVALIVQPDGSLLVRAPLRTSDAQLQSFAESHAEWIHAKQKMAAKAPKVKPHLFSEDEPFFYLGKQYPLRLVDRKRPLLDLRDAFFLASSSQPRARIVFTQWYRKKAQEVISERLSYFGIIYGLKEVNLRITSARTRWGSCSSRGTLSFPWRLVMAPPQVINYVIIHELTHLKIRNHSKQYWSQVAAIMPDYKKHIAWLKANGKFMTLD